MNKQQIIREYRAFLRKHPSLKPTDFVISAGGACVMHGLRTKTDDMDMGLSVPLYKKLLLSGKYAITDFRGTKVIPWNAHVNLHPLKKGATVMISGVCCYTAERLLRQKLRLNRPKDRDDIRKLRAILRKV